MCLGVGQLNSAYATEVVEISRYLVVWSGGGELSLRNEEVGLRDIGGGNVRST